MASKMPGRTRRTITRIATISLPCRISGRADVADKSAPKPLIGINMDYRSARKDFPAFSILSAGYYDSIAKAGGIPVAIPPLTDEDDLHRVLDVLDGFVLCGGADLDPRMDGFMLHPSMRLLDRRREEFDRMLVRLVAERRMPVLGIGCGMQLLNVSLGGSLFYHIPEDLPHALPHLDATDPNHGHALVVEPGSLMATDLRRIGDSRQQPAPHGGGRRGSGFRRDRPLPGRRGRSHRKHRGRLVRHGRAVPSRRGSWDRTGYLHF